MSFQIAIIGIVSQGRASDSYLLDDYPGAYIAYSLRKLSSTYEGSCVRIRREPDNAETDIGFDASGWVDMAAVKAFCGTRHAFITTWYDQSGTGLNLTQATTSYQPFIAYHGMILYYMGRPCMRQRFASSPTTSYGALFNTFASKSQPNTIFAVGQIEGTTVRTLFDGRNVNSRHQILSGAVTNTFTIDGGKAVTGDNFDENRVIISALFNGASSVFRNNGNEITLSSSDLGSEPLVGVTVGGNFSYSSQSAKVNQEYILYDSDYSANFAGVEANITSAFNSTGTNLFDVAPYKACWSLRKTNDSYTGYCVKVRRASDNATQDIGFDENGWVDTNAISTFCSGSAGYVDTWYDQSGASIDLSQATTGLQPQIYSGAAFYSSNGKTTIKFDSSVYTYLDTSTYTLFNFWYPYSIMTVRQWDGTISTGAAIWSTSTTNSPQQLLQASGARELWRNLDFISGPNPSTSAMQVTLGMTNGGVNVCKFRVNNGATQSQNLSENGIATTSALRIGGYSGQGYGGYITEVVAWDYDAFSKETEIFNNINTYYSVY